jgi:hypothetical protein
MVLGLQRAIAVNVVYEAIHLNQDVYTLRINIQRWEINIDSPIVVCINPNLFPSVWEAVAVGVGQSQGLDLDRDVEGDACVEVTITIALADDRCVARAVLVAADGAGNGVQVKSKIEGTTPGWRDVGGVVTEAKEFVVIININPDGDAGWYAEVDGGFEGPVWLNGVLAVDCVEFDLIIVVHLNDREEVD